MFQLPLPGRHAHRTMPDIAWPRLIYDDGELVGFSMAAFVPEHENPLFHCYLWRLNIWRRRLADAIRTLMLFCDRPETPVTIFADLPKPDATRILQMSSMTRLNRSKLPPDSP